MKNFYKELNISAFDAISKAQEISSAPMLFQAVYSLLKHNVLKVIEESPNGLSIKEIEQKTDLSEYALTQLLNMAASGRVVLRDDNSVYTLSKVGYYLLNDKMTQTNFKFTKHICYLAMDRLDEALMNRKPAGLGVFNESWETIYPHLSELPEEAKEAWFAWDHLYSQTSFTSALKFLNDRFNPKVIFDVGGNTGRFALECCKQIKGVNVKILDLPSQIKLAKENIRKHNLEKQIEYHPLDILMDDNLPTGADIWWLSQFLDCFAPEHIEKILKNIHHAMNDAARLCILEPVADRQKFEAAEFSINAGSLYFSAIANGYSGFLSTKQIEDLVKSSGFQIEEIVDNLGISNSMFVCKKV